MDREVVRGVIKLRTFFKGGASKNPDMFAMILKAYDERLPQKLMQSEPWWEDRRYMEREEQEAREEAAGEDEDYGF